VDRFARRRRLMSFTVMVAVVAVVAAIALIGAIAN
jgi:hypothetical protein